MNHNSRLSLIRSKALPPPPLLLLLYSQENKTSAPALSLARVRESSFLFSPRARARAAAKSIHPTRNPIT
jgi:hypothetical protein